MQTGTAAIILLPEDEPITGVFAQQCLSHIERRGYHLFTVVYDWQSALRVLRAGNASVVVFARHDHLRQDWTPRVEFVGDDTQDIVRIGTTRPRNERTRETGDGRNRRPRSVS